MTNDYFDDANSAAANDYQPGDFDLAIVGMAGRFPGAADLGAFWRNLADGVESISRFSAAEVAAAGIDPALSSQPHYVKAGGVLDGAEWFDATFFGFYPREAEILDPQHRVFLEVAWHALEDAGYDPATYEHAVGLYAGCGLNTYLIYNLMENREIRANVQGYQLTIANDKDFLPTRVAYKLNLRGPAVNVQTACSTSLVATHLACQALLNRDCDMALAGGVTIRLPQRGGYLYQEGGIASPDGHCRAFDAQAAGTVGGNGVGIVVLKRLTDALADGDAIRAVIKGTAINNDGSHKVGYTAPSVEGQTEVIAAAHAVADIDPATITYVEAHGTGTALGDPIEITALTNAFQGEPDQENLADQVNPSSTQWCAIGSLKTNIGHLDAAAGVAGLIKATLALENRLIPPSLNYTAPNPRIDFARSPFYVNTKLAEWPDRRDNAHGSLRRAGVSAFGIGGTNAHVVLEEAPRLGPGGSSRAAQLLVVSAKHEAALDEATANLARFLGDHPDANLADIAYTLKVGRQPFTYRRAVVARNPADAARALSDAVGAGSPRAASARTVAFMFTGQGSQYPQMGRGLYESEPIFRDAVDRCADLLRPHLGTDIRGLLYPRSVGDEASADAASEKLRQTSITQPALFVIEYALSQLWLSWGIKPDALLGHSIGEYVAAHLAGVMSLADALMIVAARGRLMGSVPPGSMLSLPVSEAEAMRLLTTYPDLTVATINAPEMVVVAGPQEAVDRLEPELAGKGIAARRLHTSHAFHSAMMDPILGAFTEVVRRARLQPPAIPYVSNITGTWITAKEATDPAYYARHLRSAVRFSDGLATLAAEPDRALLEVGPGRTLASLARSNPVVGRERAVVTSLRHPNDPADDLDFALAALGQLWVSGIAPTWDADEQREAAPWRGFYRHERRRRVPLPLYPFQRQRYWVEPDQPRDDPASVRQPERAVKTSDISRWFYVPAWRQTPQPAPTPAANRRMLVFALDRDAHDRLIELLRSRAGADVSVVRPGGVEQYETLLRGLKERGALPQAVVHLWTTGDAPTEDAPHALGFDSLMAFVRAWGSVAGSAELHINVVARGLFDVTGNEATRPEAAPILGAARVIEQEYPGVRVCVVDLGTGEEHETRLVDLILTKPADAILALRGRRLWARSFARLETQPASARLRQRGVYLITGGLGRIGLVLASHLAATAQARLVLVDRTGLPPRETWAQLLAEGDHHMGGATPPLQRKVQQVLALEAAGAEVLVIQADVADHAQMAQAVEQTVTRFGALHGVIHAAGTVGQAAIRSVAETDVAMREAQFRPKIGGAYALAAALQGRAVDFVLLMSSVSTVLGGLGFAAYAAANSFLDAFALEQTRAGRPWLSVAWDGWAFPEEQSLSAAAGALAFAITPEEGVLAFERVLSALDLGGGIAGVIVSTADLETRLAAARPAVPARPDETTDVAPAKPARKYARPAMRTAYAKPSNEVEAAIVADWENILGIAPIGVNDDFFELGGHSLLATQLVSRLRDAYQVELPLRNLFETPTAAGLAALIVRAKSAAVGIVGEAGAGEREMIRPTPRGVDLPLSFGQERLWFLDQLAPGSSLYNNFAALRLTAADAANALDPARLERALNQVIERHEVLRTVFGERDGKPTQTILPALKLSAPVIDLTGEPQIEQRIQELALQEARAPFDLTAGPLLRAKLLRVSDREYTLFFTMHHIVSDGWSVGVLIREVAAFYEQHQTLAELPIQYADYAAWQRVWLSGGQGRLARRDEQLAYWRDRLTPAPEPLELPTDRPRPAVQTSNGANHWFAVEPETYRKLDTLAKGEGATLFMALLAGLQTLLYRYTSQEDICVGTPVANRDRSETDGLIGFLLNTLVLRTDLSARNGGQPPTFRELLGRVREVALGAYAHQDLPFETLVEALQPDRDMGRAPFFQVMFDLQAAPLAGLTLPGLAVSPLRSDGGAAKFDLALSLEYGPETLGGYLNYNTDLFDADTAAAMVEHLCILLASAVADLPGQGPDAPISDLNILSAAEERRLLQEWNPPPNPSPAGQTVVAMFEAQAEARPLQPAVILADGADAGLTYAALNERANQMARCMAESGIGRTDGANTGSAKEPNQIVPDQVVGLLLHRSLDMVAAIWAVLKTGAAFLPIDPDSPVERIAFMLADSGAVALITDSPLDATLTRTVSPERVFRLDADRVRFAEQLGRNLDRPTAGSDLAYVIYTSGSTGQPKGVLIEHGGLAQHIVDVTARFGLQPADRILQFAAYTFDQGLEQVLTTLTVGGALVLRGEEIWPPADFPQVIRDYGLNVINLPPAYWNQVLAAWAPQPRAEAAHESDANERMAPPTTLRTIISGGDVLTPESLKLWQSTPAATARLINAYGPTETTVTACAFDVPADWFARIARPVPIGRPLPNRVAYVVDRNGKPTPIGVPGELWLGGNGVARGYLNRPALTAERFVQNSTQMTQMEKDLHGSYKIDPANPAQSASSALNYRLYRTGDFVRYRRDGNLEFIGRLDQQVKVRGFRIELGEIEAALSAHEGVKEAVVIAKGEGAEKRLVAYYVPAGLSPVARSLREFLTTKLPAYMLPAAFVSLPALPLNASGKLDRRALGAMDIAPLVNGAPLTNGAESDATRAEKDYVAPQTPTEVEIAAVWAEILRVPRVGIYDNFFDLGGHSLLATQIVSRVRARYPIELPLRRLFEAPTVAGLARLIEDALLAQQSEDELAALLAELDGLTDAEADDLLADASHEPQAGTDRAISDRA